MNDNKGGKMHSNLPDLRKSGEVAHLQRMAAYYDRLGCVDVARSLRGLAAAKQKSGSATEKKKLS